MQQILHKHSYKSTLYQYSFPCNHYDWAYCYNFCATIDLRMNIVEILHKRILEKLPEISEEEL